MAREQNGLRWHRCLRCDSWVALSAPLAPIRQYLPERGEVVLPSRGKTLRDRVVLRAIALERGLHFVILGLLGIAVLAFAAHESNLRQDFYRVLADLQGGVGGGPIQTSGHVGIVHELDKLFSLHSGTLRAVGIAVLAYALLEGLEAVGLWLGKRWAEYLTFLATSILLPFEVYEIVHGASVLKVVGFVINLAVVIYLLFAKRLFGLRGGSAAVQAERRQESGWGAIELATPQPSTAVTEAISGP